MFLTVDECAKQSGRDPETIRRWIRSGKLPATMRSKREGYRILPSDFYACKDNEAAWDYRSQLSIHVIDIIELFEDFLDARGIFVDNPEKEESENPSTIYGTDFGELYEGIKDILLNK